MSEFSLGDIIQAPSKSGIYIGELIEDRHDKYLVKVLAVLKHPLQGDLHHPKQVENVVFHERKALAQFEKVNVLKGVVNSFNDDIPDYGESLKSAVENYQKQLESKNTPYNTEAQKALKIVEESYYLGRYY